MYRNALMSVVAGVLATVAGQAMADDAKPVTVVNTPLPVQIVNPSVAPTTINIGNPGDIAKAIGTQKPGTVTFTNTNTTPSALVPPPVTNTLPARQRFVVEYASGFCAGIPAGEQPSIRLSVVTAGSENAHWFSVPSAGPSSFVQFGDAVRIYADAGTTMSMFLDFQACTVTLSGQFVDVP
jgi:hypothetical protein